jgi:hypothetical protein
MAPAFHPISSAVSPMLFWRNSLAENPPASFSGDARAQLWHPYASGEHRLGEERGHNARLITAIAYFRRVSEEWTRERVPLDWAKARNNPGIAIQTLGEGKAATDKAKGCAALEAARRFAAPLEEYRKASASYYVSLARGNIERLDAAIARLCVLGRMTIAITDRLALDEAGIALSFTRASGPGSQNVNQVASAAHLRFDAQGIATGWPRPLTRFL